MPQALIELLSTGWSYALLLSSPPRLSRCIISVFQLWFTVFARDCLFLFDYLNISSASRWGTWQEFVVFRCRDLRVLWRLPYRYHPVVDTSVFSYSFLKLIISINNIDHTIFLLPSVSLWSTRGYSLIFLRDLPLIIGLLGPRGPLENDCWVMAD